MTADGHTKGAIERHLLLEAMAGRQEYKYETKKYCPPRTTESNADTLLTEVSMLTTLD